MKVALVHDYLKEYGGAERVLLALHEIWPEAPIYTIFCTKGSGADKVFGPAFAKASAGKEAKIIESWFGKIPFCDKLISPFRFLIPLIWGSFDFSEYDLVISSASWAVTKGFGGEKRGKKGERGEKGKKTTEVCYCHTPPRYLYGYETSRNWKKHWWVRIYATIVNHFMRMYDFQQAQKVDFFIANSKEVAGRIKKFYRRDSEIIYPPVDIPSIKKQEVSIKERNYFLTGGRLESAKNFDLIIKACTKLGVALKVYGSGTQMDYLKRIAGPTVEFLGRVSDEEKFQLMAEAKAFIVMAKDEDFGITPVEAMAVGTPVIAYHGGGYLETVVEGKTGVFVEEATEEGVIRGIRDFGPSFAKASAFGSTESAYGQTKSAGKDIEDKIKPEDCRKQAEKFSKERFKKEISEFVSNILKDKRD